MGMDRRGYEPESGSIRPGQDQKDVAILDSEIGR